MKRRTNWFPEGLYAVLEAVAEKRGVGVAEVMRGALQEWADKQPDDVHASAKKILKAAEKKAKKTEQANEAG